MTKIEMKKNRNRNRLLKAGYDLFSVQGVDQTTVSSISHRAGLSKGSFYLYFKDKDDLRDKLVIIKSSEIINEAVQELLLNHNIDKMDFADKLLFVIDYILTKLSQDHDELRFISKNLSWGLAGQADDSDSMTMEEFIRSLVSEAKIGLEHGKMLLYTIIEMVNSTCYSMLLEDKPMPFSEYKPFL
ncbi:MAG: TetR/AcrR family transcriptional regulator, partial [Anaerovoracaceae bacterium]